MSCGRGCSDGWDVRCCCEPNCNNKNTTKMFNNCPMKLSTIHFTLGNDYNVYKYLEPLEVIDCKAVRHATKMIHRGIILTDDECNQILDFMIKEWEGYDYQMMNPQIIRKSFQDA